MLSSRISDMKAILRARHAGADVSLWSTSLSADSSLEPGARVSHHASIRSSQVGRFSSIGRFSKIAFSDIGSFCSISWDTTIGAIKHPTDRPTTHAFPYVPNLGFFEGASLQEHDRTFIGNDVWIGAGAIILPGVTIGDGAVIAAGAVVTRDVEHYATAAGVPARTVSRRISEHDADRLRAISWWNWPVDTLRSHVALFREPLSPELLSRLEDIAREQAQR